MVVKPISDNVVLRRITTARFWGPIIVCTAAFAILALILNPFGFVGQALISKFSNSSLGSFILKIAFGVTLEIALVLVVYTLMKVEKPADWKKSLKVGPPDPKGMALFFILDTIFFTSSALFLQRLAWGPIQSYLESLGLPGVAMSAAVPVPAVEHLAPAVTLIVILGLLLVGWGEAVEELFFRGYVQNRLQGRYGVIPAIFLGAIVWASMHVFSAATFFELFCYGAFVFGIAFALRQNVTPLAIMHPLANRAGLLALYILQAFNIYIEGLWPYWLAETIATWALALLVYGIWKILATRAASHIFCNFLFLG